MNRFYFNGSNNLNRNFGLIYPYLISDNFKIIYSFYALSDYDVFL